MSAPSSTSSFASAIECRAVTGGDAATELLASTRRAPTWPRRRRLALVGTRQAPHPSKHVCSAFRRLFRATQKAILQAVESGAQAAGNRDFPVALTPPVMDPAVQQVSGLMDWGGVPLHVTVVDAAAAPRGSGFPIEPSHIVGVSGILYCFSPFDRDSFAAMQALQQSIVATLAPIPCVVVAVVEESPKTAAAASDAATAQQLAAMQAAAGQKMKIKVGTKGAAQDPRVAPEPRPLERVVTPEEVEHLCREWGCRAFELSTAAVQPDLLANMVDQALRHQMSRSRQRSESPAQQRHVDPTVVVNGTHHQADKPPLATASSSTTSQPKSVDACSTPQQPPQPKTAEADSVAHALPPHQVHPQPPAQPNGANGVTQRNASNPSATGGVAASRRNHQGHCLVA